MQHEAEMTLESNVRYARICERARQIWKNEGRPFGMHETHWLMAMHEIDAEDELASCQLTDASTSVFSHAIQAIDGAYTSGAPPKAAPKFRSSRR
jgi:hypothetical protein